MKISTAVKALAVLLAAGFVGCSSHTRTNIDPAPGQGVLVIQPPGVVEYVWEEPMVDVIEVPPGLDPEGHYYRPAHQSIVEIRQGRWRYYPKPQDRMD